MEPCRCVCEQCVHHILGADNQTSTSEACSVKQIETESMTRQPDMVAQPIYIYRIG